jgi:hypothetical protein
MAKQCLLRAHSFVFTMLPIFAKCSEAVADRRDVVRKGSLLELNWASGCIGCSDDDCAAAAIATAAPIKSRHHLQFKLSKRFIFDVAQHFVL